MPRSKITGVVIAHEWDDGSSTDYTINSGDSDVLGPYVSLQVAEDVIRFYPESWEEIRDQIQYMMDDINNQ